MAKYKLCRTITCSYNHWGLCIKPKPKKHLGEWIKGWGCLCRRTD